MEGKWIEVRARTRQGTENISPEIDANSLGYINSTKAKQAYYWHNNANATGKAQMGFVLEFTKFSFCKM